MNPSYCSKLQPTPTHTCSLRGSAEMGLRSLATPAWPVRQGGIPHSPLPERALGNGMLPVFFAASAAPSRGVWGTECCHFLAWYKDCRHATRHHGGGDDKGRLSTNLGIKASATCCSQRPRQRHLSHLRRSCDLNEPRPRPRLQQARLSAP